MRMQLKCIMQWMMYADSETFLCVSTPISTACSSVHVCVYVYGCAFVRVSVCMVLMYVFTISGIHNRYLKCTIFIRVCVDARTHGHSDTCSYMNTFVHISLCVFMYEMIVLKSASSSPSVQSISPSVHIHALCTRAHAHGRIHACVHENMYIYRPVERENTHTHTHTLTHSHQHTDNVYASLSDIYSQQISEYIHTTNIFLVCMVLEHATCASVL
jgi:hypothetical protein